MIDTHLAAASVGIRHTVRQIEHSRELPSTEAIDAYVGRRLRARRIEVGLSQASLGRHFGLSFSQVQKYEKGSNRIGAGRLYRLAELLGVSVHYFFEEWEQPRPNPTNKSGQIAAAEAALLQEAFLRISDPRARQALLSLASSMVDGS